MTKILEDLGLNLLLGTENHRGGLENFWPETENWVFSIEVAPKQRVNIIKKGHFPLKNYISFVSKVYILGVKSNIPCSRDWRNPDLWNEHPR